MDLKKSVGFPALFFVYITKKSMQTVLKNLEGFYIINIDHSENLFVYHKSRRSNDQEKTKDIRGKDRTG